MSDIEQLCKWQAVGLNGHTFETLGEYLYTSDIPPVEATEYDRVFQRAQELEAERDALTREVAGLRYYIAQLERNVTQEERAYAAGIASLLLSQHDIDRAGAVPGAGNATMPDADAWVRRQMGSNSSEI